MKYQKNMTIFLLSMLTLFTISTRLRKKENLPTSCNGVVIGILANPNPPTSDISQQDNYTQVKIDKNYVDWLTQAGAIVVPISPSDPNINATLAQVNGVLLQGGGRTLTPYGRFENVSRIILNYMMNQTANNSNPMALWATCQGFEMTQMILSGVQTRNDTTFFQQVTGVEGVPLSTQPAPGVTQWRVGDYLTKVNQYLPFTTQTVNGQFHGWSVRPDVYTNPQFHLNQYLQLTSTQVDTSNPPLQFVDTFQGSATSTRYFYGSQFHPEKVTSPTFFNKVWPANVQPAATGVSQALAKFFVNEASTSQNCFSQNTASALKPLSSGVWGNTSKCASFDYYYLNTDGTIPTTPLCNTSAEAGH